MDHSNSIDDHEKYKTQQITINEILDMPCCTDCYTGLRDFGPIVCYRTSCRGHYLDRDSKPHDLINSHHSNACNIIKGFCSKSGCLGHNL